MKFKFALGLFMLASSLISLKAQEKEYMIRGTVKKSQNPTMAYLQYRGLGGEVKDSVEVKDGTFSFNGKVDEPRPASILLRQSGKKASAQDLLKFYIEPGELTVQAKSLLMNAEITGSSTIKDQKELDRLLEATQYEQPVRVVQETRMVAVPAGSPRPSGMGSPVGRSPGASTGALTRRVITDVNDLPYELQSRIAAVQENAKNKILQFIHEHPDSFVSLYTLHSLSTAKKISYAEYQPAINALSPALVDSNQGKSMRTK